MRLGAAPLPSGREWQDLVYRTARASRPYVDVQGPGYRRLFGRYGASGLPAEFDTAVNHDTRVVSILESKAVADYKLRRDAAMVLSGKIRDHELSRGFRWGAVNALVASGGLLGLSFADGALPRRST
jgi:hypothetical protein